MSQLLIVGLGSGDESQMTLGVWNALRQASRLVLRTEKHPVVGFLRGQGLAFETFDLVYEQADDFAAVYETITERLIAMAKDAEDYVVYALPGHPMVAERTTRLLLERCEREGVALQIMGGESFLDQAFLRFGFDPIEGFQLLDASSLGSGHGINPRLHTLIGQVYDTFTASDVKLSLMAVFPDETEVVVGHSLGVAGEERIEVVPLFELDRLDGYGNLSLIWVPRSEEDEVRNRTFERLREIVDILRSPEGCPWDREQTHASLRQHLIEETYEVLETIDDDDPDAMCEELGDLMLQVMLHAQIEAEAGMFDVHDVIETLNEKLLRRHPHVFGETAANNAEEALANWQQIKRAEKLDKGIDPDRASALDGVPRDLPGLLKAWKLQKKAAKVGFDWERIEDVFAKIEEEIGELRVAAGEQATPEEREDELGDVLFAVVNAARWLGVDPDAALARTNRKFVRRFGYIEERLQAEGRTPEQSDLQEMERYWQEAKGVRGS